MLIINNILTAVEFQTDVDGEAGPLGLTGHKVHYSIRFPDSYGTNGGGGPGRGWNTALTWPRSGVVNGPRSSDIYLTTDFLVMQAALDHAVIAYLKNDSSFFVDFTPVCDFIL